MESGSLRNGWALLGAPSKGSHHAICNSIKRQRILRDSSNGRRTRSLQWRGECSAEKNERPQARQRCSLVMDWKPDVVMMSILQELNQRIIAIPVKILAGFVGGRGRNGISLGNISAQFSEWMTDLTMIQSEFPESTVLFLPVVKEGVSESQD